MHNPEATEYAPYYDRYISLVTEPDIIAVLDAQGKEIGDLISSLNESQGTFAYADGKWTIKEVISHLVDAERIFGYRMLRISRGDQTPIEGWEQEGYAENSRANDRTFANLLDEFSLLRRSNLLMLKSLDDNGWKRSGTASGNPVSVRALAYITTGHVRHHLSILKERYLV